MKFRFAYIGPPFSRENPGTEIEFDEWDVPDIRRASGDWLEVSNTASIVVDPKFIKIKGKPKAVFQPGG